LRLHVARSTIITAGTTSQSRVSIEHLGAVVQKYTLAATCFISKENGKDKLVCTLTCQLFSLHGLPKRLTTKALIDWVEISAQSRQHVKLRQEYAHEPILNHDSSEFAQQPDAPAQPAMTVLAPKYTE
jgi:hypothetical protein